MQKLNVPCFRGSEKDVLDRYVQAAEWSAADVIIRVTGDCPLIDPEIVDLCVRSFRTFTPDWLAAGPNQGLPRGLDTEIMSKEALLVVHKTDFSPPAREHVTWGIYTKPERFRLHEVHPPVSYQHPHLRLCVDEEDDFRLIDSIYRKLYKEKPVSILEAFRYLEHNPSIAKLNAHVQQKKA